MGGSSDSRPAFSPPSPSQGFHSKGYLPELRQGENQSEPFQEPQRHPTDSHPDRFRLSVTLRGVFVTLRPKIQLSVTLRGVFVTLRPKIELSVTLRGIFVTVMLTGMAVEIENGVVLIT